MKNFKNIISSLLKLIDGIIAIFSFGFYLPSFSIDYNMKIAILNHHKIDITFKILIVEAKNILNFNHKQWLRIIYKDTLFIDLFLSFITGFIKVINSILMILMLGYKELSLDSDFIYFTLKYKFK